MAKKCSRDGCERDAFTRGMCKSHYNSWLVKMARLGRKPSKVISIRNSIKDVLPATRKQVAERLGVSRAPACRTIKKMHAEGKLFIGGWEPPPGQGGQWQPIFAYGPGVDVDLCAVWRDVHCHIRLRQRWARHGARKKNKAFIARGPKFSALLSPLGV